MSIDKFFSQNGKSMENSEIRMYIFLQRNLALGGASLSNNIIDIFINYSLLFWKWLQLYIIPKEPQIIKNMILNNCVLRNY